MSIDAVTHVIRPIEEIAGQTAVAWHGGRRAQRQNAWHGCSTVSVSWLRLCRPSLVQRRVKMRSLVPVMAVLPPPAYGRPIDVAKMVRERLVACFSNVGESAVQRRRAARERA